jgi:hypothetical protein
MIDCISRDVKIMEKGADFVPCSLASSELYVTIAKLFVLFDMKLFETEEDDIKQVHDFFSPFPDSERGLRVTIE